MSNTTTNEQAFDGLYEYYLLRTGDENYESFDTYWTGVVTMVAQTKLGWITEISENGYAQIVEAYNELVELGFFNREE